MGGRIERGKEGECWKGIREGNGGVSLPLLLFFQLEPENNETILRRTGLQSDLAAWGAYRWLEGARCRLLKTPLANPLHNPILRPRPFRPCFSSDVDP